MTIQAPPRKFLPADFTISDWPSLQSFFDQLVKRSIDSVGDLKQWLHDRSELESVISEDLGWRYIRMTCYTDKEEYSKSYQDFIQNIQPQIAPYSDLLNKKTLESPFISAIENEGGGYRLMVRNLKKEVELFRTENIPLYTEISTETQKYAELSGAMTVQVNGQELTLPQAGVILQSVDRAQREEVYHKIAERRLKDKDVLDELYSKLIALRHRVAQNAGFTNFRDYQFKSYGRFDYTPQDCFNFHESIASEVVPVLNEFAAEHKAKLKVSELRPWDKAVDAEGRQPLKPFESGKSSRKNPLRFSNG